MNQQYETAQMVITLANTVTNYKNSIMEKFELTSIQSETMRFILNVYKEKNVCASDLINYLKISQSTAAGIIKRLHEKEFIDFVVSDNDKRKMFIVPTKKGCSIETNLKKVAVETEKMLLNDFSDLEGKELRRLLNKLLENLQK